MPGDRQTRHGRRPVRRASADCPSDPRGGPGAGRPAAALAQALLETWRRRHGRNLPLEAYEATGGVHGAVAQSAEDLYSGLTPDPYDCGASPRPGPA
ncbi:hypothetical protein [Streptomyces sp. Ac-502]|uniref:nSTAND1 domain-containing NTPase n=1 Tax=Streptomyces sp. Ac-502 TaxID=3342801 RepID=UPI0038626EF6